jgi:hypothetical protein
MSDAELLSHINKEDKLNLRAGFLNQNFYLEWFSIQNNVAGNVQQSVVSTPAKATEMVVYKEKQIVKTKTIKELEKDMGRWWNRKDKRKAKVQEKLFKEYERVYARQELWKKSFPQISDAELLNQINREDSQKSMNRYLDSDTYFHDIQSLFYGKNNAAANAAGSVQPPVAPTPVVPNAADTPQPAVSNAAANASGSVQPPVAPNPVVDNTVPNAAGNVPK